MSPLLIPVYRFCFTIDDNQLAGAPLRYECCDDAAALAKAGELARTMTKIAKGIEDLGVEPPCRQGAD